MFCGVCAWLSAVRSGVTGACASVFVAELFMLKLFMLGLFVFKLPVLGLFVLRLPASKVFVLGLFVLGASVLELFVLELSAFKPSAFTLSIFKPSVTALSVFKLSAVGAWWLGVLAACSGVVGGCVFGFDCAVAGVRLAPAQKITKACFNIKIPKNGTDNLPIIPDLCMDKKKNLHPVRLLTP